jgi:hypothetical protein
MGNWLSVAVRGSWVLFWGMGTLEDRVGAIKKEEFKFSENQKKESNHDGVVEICDLHLDLESDLESEPAGDLENNHENDIDSDTESEECTSARVTHVAVGMAHIVMSLEENTKKGEKLRAVWTAGRGQAGQLGIGVKLDFQDDFTDVDAFKGKKIKDIKCEAFSTWVLVEREDDSNLAETWTVKADIRTKKSS